MIIRPVDAQGDMMPISKADQMITGARAVAQAVKARLGLNYGEWWEDEEIGFQIPDFLAETYKTNQVDVLAKYIVGYISETKEVSSVSGVNVWTEGRTMYFSATINTQDESVNVEVNLSELF